MISLQMLLALLLACGAATNAAEEKGDTLKQSQVLFVSPDGDDANAGTDARPWRTVQKAAATLTAGQTAFVKEGIYTERVVVANSGAEGSPITLRNYPGHAPVLDAQGLDQSWGVIEMHGKAHVRIAGLHIQNARRGQAGIVALRSSHIAIEGCHVLNTSASGILIWECDHVTVQGNEVERACQDGGEESVTVKFGSDMVEVHNNHIHHTGHEGVDVKEGVRNVRVYNNHIHHVERQGLYADAWDRETFSIEFFNNVLHDCGFGLAVCSEMGGLLHDVRAFNNIIYNNRGPGLVVADWGGRRATHPIRDVFFVNNTLYNNGASWGGGLLIENPEAENIVVRNNIFCANGPPQILVNRAAMSTSISHNLFDAGGGNRGTDWIEGDPQFVDAEAGDFHLRPGSPAIDTGSPDAAPSEDFEGDPRPCGKGYDIGADEHCLP